ncbi:Voltage-gated ClC-type chloride channel ClcB [Sulfuracidifex tepidarius]|uniref:Voltage-gated ClC-type chloride channel ClcB n=1 Tax=Sulfuracidifex tepidarius TaxID=1294262 RepID=A0A510DX90_9CREN|nr:chloride channel protein [Sulfuracidifex tepidarius]BBG24814.1 Voltage-gated ClC-type chloride channel ClcB [Sulfuracidifex tepidarius]
MSIFDRLHYFEKWFILGAIVGVVAGLAATTFYELLHLMEFIFLFKFIGMSYPRPLGEGGTLSFVFNKGHYYLIPFSIAIGGAISGFIVYTFAPEAEGHGTDAAIRAYHDYQGKMRWVVVPVKVIASAVTIGSGGSAGREGPTAQFSAGIGSLLGDLFKLSPEDRRRMVAIGIGAGIGTIFKTPIGGALLAAEILYRRDLEPELIYPGLVASAIGYVIFGSFFGFTPVFGYYLGTFSPFRLPMYAVLGLVSGVMAILYVKSFYGVQYVFKRLKISNYFKPVIGGLIMGAIALVAPEVIGTGYGWINLTEYAKFNAFYSPVLPLIVLLVSLPFLKILATSFSIGSGGSGGVYAPGLVIGATLGADIGLLFHYLFPQVAPAIAPFVIIGMAAFFGAAGKVPLSVIVMVTEMTGSLQILPGAMIAVAISYLVSGNYTIYRAQVPTRRDSPAHKMEYETPVMKVLKVKDAKLLDIRVKIHDKVETALSKMTENNFMSLPVTDDNDNFVGAVFLRDLEKADRKDTVARYVIKGVPYVKLDSSFEDCWEIMARLRSRWVCVVDGEKYIGVLPIDNLLQAYEKTVRNVS